MCSNVMSCLNSGHGCTHMYRYSTRAMCDPIVSASIRVKCIHVSLLPRAVEGLGQTQLDVRDTKDDAHEVEYCQKLLLKYSSCVRVRARQQIWAGDRCFGAFLRYGGLPRRGKGNCVCYKAQTLVCKTRKSMGFQF
jgi:hypothetical protein